MPVPTSSTTAVRTVAAFEAFKGVLAFLVATGSLTLMHKDVHQLAVRLVEHTHLNPAARYPGIFLEAANHLQDSRLLLLAVGAATYCLVRGVEAYGLYTARAWAEVLAAGGGAVYVPVELVELVRRPSWLGLALLVANLAVVAVVVQALLRRRAIGKNAAGCQMAGASTGSTDGRSAD
jgi:uncharacterized membrane protein (DUF2068 family)